MGRIEKKFTELSAGNKKALVVYITAGDPSIKVTGQLLPVLEKAGADIIEVGVPFPIRRRTGRSFRPLRSGRSKRERPCRMCWQ